MSNLLLSIRRVLPPQALSTAAVLLVLCIAGEMAFMGWLYLQYGALPDKWNAFVVYRGALVAGLGGWAWWRAMWINPVCRSDYRRWLLTTPWTPDRPLPLGPVGLVWQDGVVLLAVAALFARWPESLYVPLAFLVPYSAIVTNWNFYAGERDGEAFAAGAIAALLPWSLTSQGSPVLSLTLGIVVAVIASVGWRATLQAFPWDTARRWAGADDRKRRQEQASVVCQWWPLVHPYRGNKLGPVLAWREVVMAATLVAWLAAVAIFTWGVMVDDDAIARRKNFPETSTEDVAWVLTRGVGVVAAGLRLVVYACWCMPPLSFRGRRKRQQWIIPGYDRVLVAPVVTLALAYVLPRALEAAGAPLAVVGFVTVWATTMAALGTGPTLSTWMLTGQYRMASHTPKASQRRAELAMARRGND